MTSEPQARTILLVEDEALIAMNEQRLLNQYGYHVLTAFSGEAALEVISSGVAIDLILMDIDLGNGIDGTEAAERILAERSIPILFLSSHSEREIVERTERITSYGYVVKNSSITVLDASIKMAFKLHAADHLLQQERDTLRSVMTASPIGLLVVNEDLIVVEANPAAETISGRKLSAMDAPRCGDFLGCQNRFSNPHVCGHTESCAACGLYNDIRRTLATGTQLPRKDVALELSPADAPGESATRWIRYSTSLLHRNGGLAVLVTLEDITDDRARNEQMRLLSTLAESEHNMVVITDAERRTIWVNPPFMRLTGYTLDDVLGKNPGELLQGERPDMALKNKMTAAFDRGEAYQTEILNFTRTGRPYWIYMDVQPVRDEHGTLTHFVSIQHDISTQREAVQGLAEQDRRIRAIVDRTNDGIVALDAAGTVIYANDRYCEMLGQERDAILGMESEEVLSHLHPEEAEHLTGQIYAAIARGDGEMEYRYRSRTPAGSYRWRADHVVCFYGSSGKLEQSWVMARYVDDDPGFTFRSVGRQ